MNWYVCLFVINLFILLHVARRAMAAAPLLPSWATSGGVLHISHSYPCLASPAATHKLPCRHSGVSQPPKRREERMTKETDKGKGTFLGRARPALFIFTFLALFLLQPQIHFLQLLLPLHLGGCQSHHPTNLGLPKEMQDCRGRSLVFEKQPDGLCSWVLPSACFPDAFQRSFIWGAQARHSVNR